MQGRTDLPLAGRLDQLWQLFSCALALNIVRPGVLWPGQPYLTQALDLAVWLCDASPPMTLRELVE
jgi:hypothetical protein